MVNYIKFGMLAVLSTTDKIIEEKISIKNTVNKFLAGNTKDT